MRNKPGQTLKGFGSDEDEKSPFILTCSPFLRVMEVDMRLGGSAGLSVGLVKAKNLGIIV